MQASIETPSDPHCREPELLMYGNRTTQCMLRKHVATAGPASITGVGYEDSTAAAVPTACRARVQGSSPSGRSSSVKRLSGKDLQRQ